MAQPLHGLKAGPPGSAATSARKTGPVSTVDTYSTSTAIGVSASTAVTTTQVTEVTEVCETEVTEVAEVAEVVDIFDISDTSIASSDVSWAKVPEVSIAETSEAPTSEPLDTSSGTLGKRFDSYEAVSPPLKVSKVTTTTSVSDTGTLAVASDATRSTFSVSIRESKPVKKSFKTVGLKHGVAGNKLVIGIDFGTTYTGIAYGLTSDPSNIKIIKEWPGRAARGRNDIVKIPTIISYGAIKDDNVKEVTFDWGHKVSDNAKGVIRGFKLGLDPSKRAFWTEAAGIPEEDDMVHFHEETARVEMDRLFRSTVEIVADYIGAAYKHALAKIRKAEVAEVAALPKQFVITVPAIWSDIAKSATLQAARLAHPDLNLVNPEDLVTEPEAAALYALQGFQNRGLNKGDTFVLCDAGGGTVDLISYQITSLEPRIQVKEVVSATGGAVGSMMINNGFERYLWKILGNDVLTEMKSGDGTSFSSVMRDFDQKIKPYFCSAQQWDNGGHEDDEDDEGIDNIIEIPGVNVKDDPENNVIENTLTITGDVLEEIFNPLVNATEKLVHEQIEGVKLKTERGPKYILLVGGFGASPYLNRRLEEMVESESIQVVRPEDAQAAVVKGAVLYKMPNTVQVISSVAPVSLGVRANVQYNPLDHPSSAAAHVFTDPNEGVTRVPKMTWFIMKGSDLNRDDRVRFPCYRDIPPDYKPENLRFEDELEESDEILPPQFPWEGKGVRRKCVLTSDLGGVDESQLVKRRDTNGSEYYSIHYELVVAIQSAIMTFSVECQGKTFALANVEF